MSDNSIEKTFLYLLAASLLLFSFSNAQENPATLPAVGDPAPDFTLPYATKDSVAAEEQGKTISVNIAPSVRTRGDRELLAEMLANLLDNAIRHTPLGTHIDVSLQLNGSKIIASVADNGPGVPSEAKERIFQRFYRLDRSAKVEGTGLGLALVAAVSGLHGWQLSIAR